MSQRALGFAVAAAAAAVLIAMGLVGLNQAHIEDAQAKIKQNERRIAALQLEIGRLEAQDMAGRLDRERLLRLVQALQRQVHQLGGTPVALAPSPETPVASAPAFETGPSAAPPRPSNSLTPAPSPTRTRSPRPTPSPSPSALPSICLVGHCVQ